MNFPLLRITSQMITNAAARDKAGSDKFGKTDTVLVKNPNIRKSGFLGEQVVAEFFPELKFGNSTDFDFLLNGVTFEVKTHSGEPKDTDMVYVQAYQSHRKFDYLIFTKVTHDFRAGFLLGFVSKREFFEKAVLHKKGSNNGKYTLDSDRYILPVTQLQAPEHMDLLVNLLLKKT